MVSLDRLAEDVWAGHPPEGWVTTVQIYVSHLRQALEPDRARGAAGEVLVTRNHGYLLRVDRERLDAARFEDGFMVGRAALEAGRYAEAADTLRTALGLWRSGVLADLADYAFTRPEAARLEELRLAATEARIDADLALGRHDAPPSWSSWSPNILCGSGCTASSCWRCTGAAAGRRAGRLPPGPRPARRRARHRPREPLRRLHASVLAHDPALDWHGNHQPPAEGQSSGVDATADGYRPGAGRSR